VSFSVLILKVKCYFRRASVPATLVFGFVQKMGNRHKNCNLSCNFSMDMLAKIKWNSKDYTKVDVIFN
jgi:hypothetical protein